MGRRRASEERRNRDRDGPETSGARTKTSKIKHLHQSHDRPSRSAGACKTPPSSESLRRGEESPERTWLTKLIPSQEGISPSLPPPPTGWTTSFLVASDCSHGSRELVQ